MLPASPTEGQWKRGRAGFHPGYPDCSQRLYTTVTTGIVSGEARSVSIISRPGGVEPGRVPACNTGAESFIQTDAAVSSGSSGGVLVNTD